MTILVDKQEIAALQRAINRTTGEKRRVREKKLKKLLEIADEVKDLRVDFIILGSEKGYIVERKEIGDLVGSLQEGRFWNQLRNLHIVAKDLLNEYGIPMYPILVIEGNEYKQMRKARGKLRYNQWIGILAGIAEMGIGIIKTGSFDGTINALKVLDRRTGKNAGKYRSVTIKKEQFSTIDEEAVYVLSVVKGIGPKKAFKLLEKYGSVYNVIQLDKDVLMKELGKKTGEHLYEVIHFEFKRNKRLSEFVKGGN